MARKLLMSVFLLLPAFAGAATVSGLIHDRLETLQGEPLGTVDELIVDVRAGRVAYVVIAGKERSYTVPLRALDARKRVNLDLANAVARDTSPADPRFRRAGRLVGLPVTNPGDGRIGTIADIEFDLQSGRVEQVRVSTPQGARNMPAAVLAHGRFPPLTQWQVENPSAETSGHQGFVRREPSDERRRLHDHEWDGQW
jgi:sporulation protein YlmC with PRC-barrel domain